MKSLAGHEGLEPPTFGVGDRRSASWASALRWLPLRVSRCNLGRVSACAVGIAGMTINGENHQVEDSTVNTEPKSNRPGCPPKAGARCPRPGCRIVCEGGTIAP